MSVQPPASYPPNQRPRMLRRVDVTRDAHDAGNVLRRAVRFTWAFRVWAAERVCREANPPIRRGPTLSTVNFWWERVRAWERSPQTTAVMRALAASWEVELANVRRWTRDYLNDTENDYSLTDGQRAELDRWERLLPHREKLRAMLAFADAIAETPTLAEMRPTIERVTAALDDAAMLSLRPAIDAYIMAADLAVEVDRLVASAKGIAEAAYTAREAELDVKPRSRTKVAVRELAATLGARVRSPAKRPTRSVR